MRVVETKYAQNSPMVPWLGGTTTSRIFRSAGPLEMTVPTDRGAPFGADSASDTASAHWAAGPSTCPGPRGLGRSLDTSS